MVGRVDAQELSLERTIISTNAKPQAQHDVGTAVRSGTAEVERLLTQKVSSISMKADGLVSGSKATGAIWSQRIVGLGATITFSMFVLAGPLTASAATTATNSNPNSMAGASATSAGKANHADAYYHFTLGHLYEDSATETGSADLGTQAIEQYKLAMDYDPDAPFLQNSLADLYFRMGRIREAVVEAQQVLQQHPNNLDAHKLLGRVYLRSLGDANSDQPSASVLHLAIGEFEKIVELEPSKIENHLLLGQLYGLNHDTAKAKQQMEEAHQIDANSEDAVLSLARLYSEQGDAQHAITILKSVSQDDRTPKIEFALGNNYDLLHDTKNAILAYQIALDNDPDNLDAQRALAQDLLQTGKDDQALQLFQGIAAEDPQDVQSYLRVAELERDKGHLDKSQAALDHARTLEPDSVEVHYNQALLDEAQGQLAAAADGLEKLVTASTHTNGVYTDGEKSNLAIFLDHLATVYTEQSRTDAAVGVYKKMIALGGEIAERGYQGEVDAYRDGRMWQKATEAARAAVAAEPKSTDLKLTLASQLADSGKTDEGIAIAKGLLLDAKTANPSASNATGSSTAATGSSPAKSDTSTGTSVAPSKIRQQRVVLLTLAQIDTRAHRWKDATSALDEAEKISPKAQDMMFVDFQRGAMEERQKHYAAAETAFRKALALSPNNPMTLNYLGYMMADHNMNLDEALKMVQQAVLLDPQNGAYLDSLGWARVKLGQYALAEESLQKASERIPNDPTVHDHLGELYAKTGRLRQAITQWERSVKEYASSAPGDAEPGDVSKVEKKLENAKVKLAKEETHSPAAHKSSN